MSKYEKDQLSEEMAATLEEQRDERFDKVRWRYRIVVILLLVAIILLAIRLPAKQPVVLAPDYPLVEQEPNAFPSKDNETKLEAADNGGAVAIIYSDQVSYDLSDNKLTLQYTNPSNSTAAVIVQIIIYGPNGEEYLLAESGAMVPGYAVTTLDGDMDSSIVLVEGAYSGVMRLLFYNPATGERAIVNTEIPVTITVE